MLVGTTQNVNKCSYFTVLYITMMNTLKQKDINIFQLHYNPQTTMQISKFAQRVGMPIADYFSNLPKTNAIDKKQISFINGDRSSYDESFKMPQQGYQLFKKNVANENNHGYTMATGTPTAKKGVLTLYKPQFDLTEANVIINHGANMGLLSLLTAFTNEDDEILVPQIGYPIFADLCPAMKRKAICYKLKKQSNFQIDLNDLQSKITDKTQFIFVVNPSNPMGAIFSEQHMKDIINVADKHQLPIVSDEVYMRQSFPGKQHLSFGEVTVDVPVIIVSGMQKLFNVAGWATSWLVIFDKNKYLSQIVANLNVISTIFLHSNKITMEALGDIINVVDIRKEKEMAIVKEKHDSIVNKIRDIPALKPYEADGTVYLTVEVDTDLLKDINDDRQFTRKIAEEENVQLLPLSIFGEIQGFRLITCGQVKVYEEFYVRLTEFIKNHLK